MLLFFYKTKEDYKSMKTALSILMAIFLAFSVSTVSMAFAADVSSATTLLTASKKKTVKLSAKKATIYYKGTKFLKLLNNKKKVKWYTSNKKVATVSSKGKVTAKGLGTAKITAKVGSKKYTCKVTVKDRNVGTAIGFVTNGGGYFIKGESVAKVTIRPKKYDCAKAVVSIKDAADDVVFTKTLKTLKKNTNYSFTWDAKDNKGNELPAGSYKVSVKIGNTVSNSAYLAYKTVNDFDGGNGSASKPFEVGSTTQLAKIVKYPAANFKQTEDLDFGFEATGGFFTSDLPFEGVYDGNNKTIMNISASTALFEVVGEKGTVKNVVMKGCVSSDNSQYSALLVKENKGKIIKCSFENCALSNNYGGEHRISSYTAMVAGSNTGTISSCTVKGSVSGTINSSYSCPYTSGIVGYNAQTGKVLDCFSEAEATSHTWDYPRTSGIAGCNDGIISGCEASGALIGDGWYTSPVIQIAGITIKNNGQIINSSYTGKTECQLVIENNGNIL